MVTKCVYCGEYISGDQEEDPTHRFHKGCATECCKHCGKCCQTLLIPTRFEYSDTDSLNFYEKRGVFTVKDNMGGITLVTVNECKHFEKGKGCDIYRHRPYWCAVYEPRDDPFHSEVCPLGAEFNGDMAPYRP